MTECEPMSMPIELGLHLSCHDCSPLVNATFYCQLIGGLIYLAYTRLDICYASAIFHDWTMTKYVLRYVRGIDSYGLEYMKNDKFVLFGYTDADYGGFLDDRRSTTRYVFFLGSGPISWGSKKQSITSKSTTKFEYCAAGDAVCEAVWLCRILKNIGILHKQLLFCITTIKVTETSSKSLFSRAYQTHLGTGALHSGSCFTTKHPIQGNSKVNQGRSCRMII